MTKQVGYLCILMISFSGYSELDIGYKQFKILAKQAQKMQQLGHNDSSFQYQEDSFDGYEHSEPELQNWQPPSAIPAGHARRGMGDGLETGDVDNYDLTFKKQVGGGLKEIKFGGRDSLERKQLFSQVNGQVAQSNPICSVLARTKSINQCYQQLLVTNPRSSTLLPLLSSTLAQNQHQMSQYMGTKLKTLISMLTIKTLRKKKNSAKVNAQAIKATGQGQDMSQAEKKRVQLLGMLGKQIEKKLVVEGLRYNGLISRWKLAEHLGGQQQEVEEGNGDSLWEEQFNNPQNLKQTSQRQTSQANQSPQKTTLSPVQSPYYNHTRLAVFAQIIESFANKVLYPAFKAIFAGQNERQGVEIGDQYALYTGGNQEYEQQQEQEQIEQVRENPVQAIYKYIRSLKNEYARDPIHKNQILRNYFLKWKIFFLQNMAHKLQMQLESQEIEEKQHIEIEKDYISNKSVEGGDLKEEKYQLKQYLRVKRMREAIRNLNQNRANKEINLIMSNYWKKNLMSKAFRAFIQNRDEAALDSYAQHVAENQIQQQWKTASIYYNTNNLAKAYFGLKNLYKHSKFVRSMQKFVKAHSFKTLKQQTCNQIQNQCKLSKHIERKRKQTLFKYFISLKNETSFSNDNCYKVEQCENKRNAELVEVCFSALSLAWKKGLAKHKRVEGVIKYYSARRFFGQMFRRAERQYEQRGLETKADFVVGVQRKQSFFQCLSAVYVKSLLERKLEIKSAKFSFEILKHRAKQSISSWRKLSIRTKNYKTIQLKLRKVKELQSKQKLWKIWQDRLAQKYRSKKKDKLTTNHNIWLNKYYKKLCQIEQQQII